MRNADLQCARPAELDAAEVNVARQGTGHSATFYCCS
jgi:hypothetical protein